MGEALITRRGGGGGGGEGLESYDATLSANGTAKMRVLVDTTGWEPGLYRGMFVYFSGNIFYTFCPYYLVKSNGDYSFSALGADMISTMQDMHNYPNYYNSPSHQTCGVTLYSPSTNVRRLEYNFNTTVNNGTIEVLCAKFFKIAL